jgi:hypothetical protein
MGWKIRTEESKFLAAESFTLGHKKLRNVYGKKSDVCDEESLFQGTFMN